MTEGFRHRAVRRHVYDSSPGAVAVALVTFLEYAGADGRLAIEDCGLAVKHLMGLLDELLHQALTLHVCGITTRIAALWVRRMTRFG